MTKEEIKDYLRRVDELELKLTGDDKEIYQWVLFGFNECAGMLNEKEQENKQLQDRINKAIEYIEKEVSTYDPDLNGIIEILRGDNNDN